MYLLDTDVMSALRRADRNPRVGSWMKSISPTEAYLSVVSIGEIERGVVRQRRKNPPHAIELENWLGSVIGDFGERILPVTLSVAQHWGSLSGALGHNDPDLIIAATALEHRLTVVTRNVSDFLPTGVDIFDPFTGARHGLA